MTGALLGHADGAGGWPAWALDPALVSCAIAIVVYALGRGRIVTRHPRSPSVSRSRVWWFGLGMALLVVVLSPPLDAAADDLFSVHMVQHLVLGLVAPLAFVMARPLRVMAHVGPRRAQLALWCAGHRTFGRARKSATPVALALVTLHVVAFSAWHAPVLYDAAVDHESLHLVEHATMFLAGLGLWWVLVAVGWHARSGLAALYLFLVGLPMGALGALLTLAPDPLYTAHLATAAEWGLTPLEDQQLAGGIMWVPGGLVYLAAASVLFVRWLAAGPQPGQEVLQWES